MDESAAESRLLAERAATAERLESMRAELAAVAAASAGSNLDDEHDPEGATVAFEREQLAGLRTHTERHLLDVDAALYRLRDGSYGTCERCGQPIGDARLEALPATRVCVTCAAARRAT